jgi:outer membrane lipoprotein LolB
MNLSIFMTKRLFAGKLLCTALSPLIIGLTACQSLIPPPLPRVITTVTLQTTPVDDRIHAVIKDTPPINFSITGKIGVRTAKQSGSAFYAWSQEGERFAIDLTGALGIGQTHIEGIPGRVSLQSAKTGFIEASTPEALLQSATGWRAPISYLPHWITGQPVDSTSPITRDAQQRILTLNEGGWDVAFHYDDQANLQYPNRLVMHQMTMQADPQFQSPSRNNRVILTIQRKIDASKNQSSNQSSLVPSTNPVSTSSAPQ